MLPTDGRCVSVHFKWFTFNMPSEHAQITLRDVHIGAAALHSR
jgi:acyl-CoA dehydrogenase